MKLYLLRHKLLASAIVISLLMALANVSAVSWLVRHQYLQQSSALLEKAHGIINDSLAERRRDMLEASRQLATQKNLGATIWYLAQYARSDLDRETLFNTYLQLARETRKTGHIGQVSRISIYDADGHLVSFAHFDGPVERVGFAERSPNLRLQVSELQAGEEIGADNLRTVDASLGWRLELARPLQQRDGTHYTVVDGLVAIETSLPIMDAAFDPTTGQPETKQVGQVTMVQPLDEAFVRQLSRLTDAEINVFTPQGFSSGTMPTYRQPAWRAGRPSAAGSAPAMMLDEVAVAGVGFYQGLIPLFDGEELAGSIAVLRSKAIVEKNAWEMIRILWLIGAASLVLIVPFAWYFATTVSRPLTLLSQMFRRVAARGQAAALDDDLAMMEKEKFDLGEMGDLTRSFLAMNEAVNQKIQQINDINASLEHTVNERTAALAAKEQESRTLIDNTPDSIARYDLDCRRIYVNPAFVAMAGCGIAALLGKRPSEHPGGANAEIYETKIREVLATGAHVQFELKWSGRDGKDVCSHIRLTPETDLSGRITSVLAVGRDISERIEFEEMIWRQANFDTLTGLPNRQMFQARLEQEAKLCQRSKQPIALMLIDLDRFKEVNDTLGHDQGDLLLVEAANRISCCVRETDTVARLGGDEFTVILPGLGDIASTERIAQQIIGKLTEPFRLGADEAFVSASIGITLYPDDAERLDVLFKNADQAMYQAKSAGRDRFCFFTADLQARAQQRLRLANDLRAALAGAQFRIHYQPIIELATGRILKAEALIRWQHPERGLISPAEFIPLAEETSLIVPIGDWIFKAALEQARQWRSRFDDSFQISVNTSPVQIRQADAAFMAWPDYLQQQRMPGQSIAVEITEGVLLNAEAEVNKKLLKFRDAGIQVAIDDFGTGYSSLSYLKRFDIDYLKIDRSFVRNLGTDPDDLALCEAIIVMAHRLGLKVIAEGVETPMQGDLLVAAGCDFAQGYLYSEPVTAEQMEALLAGAAAIGR